MALAGVPMVFLLEHTIREDSHGGYRLPGNFWETAGFKDAINAPHMFC